MSKVQKISISLTPRMNEIVQDAVDDGGYASVSEIVREALRDWHERRETPQLTLEDLRNMWEEGESSGPGRLGSFAAIRTEAHRRLAEQELP